MVLDATLTGRVITHVPLTAGVPEVLTTPAMVTIWPTLRLWVEVKVTTAGGVAVENSGNRATRRRQSDVGVRAAVRDRVAHDQCTPTLNLPLPMLLVAMSVTGSLP